MPAQSPGTSQPANTVSSSTPITNPANGWIGSTHHGEVLVPLYHTKDGGETWKPNTPSN